MTIDQLRRVHQAKPFVPFVIHLADGRALRVEHPKFMAQSPAGRTIAVGMPDDSLEIVDLLLVVSLKTDSNRSRRRSGPRST